MLLIVAKQVLEKIRYGFAQAGVLVRLACEEEGVDFLAVSQETYDLCIPEPFLEDPRIRALIEVVRSPSYRKLLDELPGHHSDGTGEKAGVLKRVATRTLQFGPYLGQAVGIIALQEGE